MARQDFRDYVTTVRAQFPGKMPKPGKVRKTFEIYTQDRLLLNYPGAIGVKTGWTTKARGTFVGRRHPRRPHPDRDGAAQRPGSWGDSARPARAGASQRRAGPAGRHPRRHQPAPAPRASGGSVAGPPGHARTAAMAAHDRTAAACPGGSSCRSCWSWCWCCCGRGCCCAARQPAAVGHDARPGASVARAAPGEDCRPARHPAPRPRSAPRTVRVLRDDPATTASTPTGTES